MKTEPEYNPHSSFEASAPHPNAPPPYMQQMTQPAQYMPLPTQQMPQPCNVTPMSNQPGLSSQPAQYVIAAPHLGETPVRMVCPNCRADMVTAVMTECSTKQHIICLLMFLSGILSFCSCLPYCCNDCSIYKHSCPRCHAHIGSYSP